VAIRLATIADAYCYGALFVAGTYRRRATALALYTGGARIAVLQAPGAAAGGHAEQVCFFGHYLPLDSTRQGAAEGLLQAAGGDNGAGPGPAGVPTRAEGRYGAAGLVYSLQLPPTERDRLGPPNPEGAKGPWGGQTEPGWRQLSV